MTYFTAFVRVPSIEVLYAAYGAFDPAELSAKDQADPARILAANLEHDEKLVKKAYRDPVVSEIASIAYRSDGVCEMPVLDERAVLAEFWARFEQSSGDMAGWGILDRDLHFIKVRSWKNGIPVPARAMRPAGTGRVRWVGFVDMEREYTGSPLVTKELGFVSRAFGGSGQKLRDQAVIAHARHESTAGMEELRALADHDLSQVEMIAKRIGVHSDGGLIDLGNVGPVDRAEAIASTAVYSDIETAPSSLEELKRICGEFDPTAVKMGNIKDPAKRAAKLAEAEAGYDESLLKRSTLEPELGRICAIGYCDDAGSVTTPRASERELLVDFWRRWEGTTGHFIGWNFIPFDLEWIKIRSWIHGIAIPGRAYSRAGNGYARWHRVRDLMFEFLGSPKGYESLDRVAKLFGGQGKCGDGAQFWRLWESEDPAEREQARVYLSRDVTETRIVGKAMGFGESFPSTEGVISGELGLEVPGLDAA